MKDQADIVQENKAFLSRSMTIQCKELMSISFTFARFRRIYLATAALGTELETEPKLLAMGGIITLKLVF